MEQEFRAEAQELEARFTRDGEKRVAAITVERDQATAKIKALEAREAAIRKETAAHTEASVKAEAEKKLKVLLIEREKATAKIKQLEETTQNGIDEARIAFAKDRDIQLQKLQSNHNRDREQLQEKINGLTRQLQRKTANELGEGAEADVYEALRDAFAHDDISRIKKGEPGADIRHEVLHKSRTCGTILIDSKNRQGWQKSYVTKLREDQTAAKADYAILATSVFPSGKKEFFVDADTRVMVVSHTRAVEIVSVVRAFMIRMHLQRLSLSERSEKRDLLYKYMTSENYRQHVLEAGRLSTDILGLDVEEKRAHDKIWEKRGKMTMRLRNAIREIDTEVSAILERTSATSASR